MVAFPSRFTPIQSPVVRLPTVLPDVKTMGASSVPTATSSDPRVTTSAAVSAKEVLPRICVPGAMVSVESPTTKMRPESR
jgi:hypothetical protein